MPSSEQREFAASLRELLAKADVPSLSRSGEWRPLWTQLADVGVCALGTPVTHGGFGADAVDLVIGFEELGRAAVPGPWIESVAALPALLAGTSAADQLPLLASGAVVASLAAPPDVPFAVAGADVDELYLLQGGTLRAATAGAHRSSVDRSRRLVEAIPGAVLAEGVDAARAADLGALAAAAQALGAGEALLDRATAYAQQRQQFGRAIGSFQAVKHQLADVLVGLQFARPLLFGAALAVRDLAVTQRRDVSAAKVACTEAAYRAARVALQVHGAIGYTAEYDLSLWLTSVRALVPAWGTPRVHRDRVLGALQ